MNGYFKILILIIGSILVFGGYLFLKTKNNSESEVYKAMNNNNNNASNSTINNKISSTRINKANDSLPSNPNLGVNFDENKLADIWLAGGCFWGVEAYMERVYGVYDVTVGYANGKTKNPTYNDVLSGSGHAETVHVSYDPSKVTLKEILNMFFKVVDPTSLNKQGNDIGTSYRSGIYYKNIEDTKIINEVINDLSKSFKSEIVVEVKALDGYYLAEDYHQDYLYKNSNGYCHIRFDAIKDQDLPITKADYKKPDIATIKSMLTPLQYKVTQEEGTEQAFNNEYWDNKKQGIYVDIVSKEPLFSSKAKYDSKTGWPSFYEPISNEFIKTKEDNSIFSSRIEVRSNYGDSHLGHVFNDGPVDKGGLRYCMNSASLEFIPLEVMESRGYSKWINLAK